MNKFLELLETKRQDFLKLYKKAKIYNSIAMVFFTIALGADFFFLMASNMTLALIVAGLVIAVLFVYSKIMKVRLGRATYDYIYDFYRSTSGFYYNQPFFSDIVIEEKKGIELNEFAKTLLFDNLGGIVSRNQVSGKINGRGFSCSDAGVRTFENGKTAIVFYGKVFSFDHKGDEEPIVVYIKANKDKILINTGNHLKVAENSDHHVIYSPSGDIPKALNSKMIKWISKFELDADIADASITITKEKVYLVVSYSERIMNVAYQQPMQEEGIKRFISELDKISSFCSFLD